MKIHHRNKADLNGVRQPVFLLISELGCLLIPITASALFVRRCCPRTIASGAEKCAEITIRGSR
jgi:hypothetical protein